MHLAAGEEIGVVKQSQMVGIQGKKRVRRTKISSGLGTGGKLDLAYPSYTYEAEPGFAEHDLDEFDGVAADLAWSRSLAAARKVFGINPDLEVVLENNIQSKWCGLLARLMELTEIDRQTLLQELEPSHLNIHNAQDAPRNIHANLDRRNRC